MLRVGQNTLPQGSTGAVNNIPQFNIASLPATSITPRTQQSETLVNSFPGNTIQIPPGEVGHVTDPASAVLEISYEYNHQTQSNQQTPGETKLLHAIVTDQKQVIPPEVNKANAVPQSVTRFAINPLSVSPGTPANPYTLVADQLHHIELFILQKALEKLYSSPTVSTVIMDIFATDKNTGEIRFTSINGQTINTPETHSVVLWKKNANNLNQVFLIDPSNVTFSERLDKAYPNYDKGTTLVPSTLTKATIPGKVIYNGGDATIPRGYIDVDSSVPTARDCVDIAVKIAFEIQVQIAINTPAHGIEAAVYAKISNQMQLNDTLRPRKNPLNGTILRPIQSSIPELRTWMPIITISKAEKIILKLSQSASASTSSGASIASSFSSSVPPAPQ